MALHVLSPTEAIIAVHLHIGYVDLKSNRVEKYQLPKEEPTINPDDGSPIILPPGIQNMAMSHDSTRIAVSTRQKYLYVYTLDSRSPLQLTQVARTVLSRVSNRIRFSADDKTLLVGDKTGDCYLWQYEGADGLKPVCGHLSMVMDVFFNDDESALITCDRDEKIRVTGYPDTHNIIAYCMGHTEYVAQMDLVPHNPKILASISGDQTIRFWNYLEGKEIFRLPLAGSGAYMTWWANADGHSSTVACNIYQSNVLQVFEVQANAEGDGLKMKSTRNIEMESHTHFKSIGHCAGGGIITLTMNTSPGGDKIVPRIDKFEFNAEDRSYVTVDLAQLNETLRQELSADAETEDKDEVAVLFKKRVNNIIHYHESKRKRIEARSK